MIEQSGKRSLTIPQTKKALPVSEDILKLVESSLDGDKAENVVVIDLTGKTAIADSLVIASGTSQRHVSSMAEHIQRALKTAGLKRIAVEGAGQSDWVLIDAGDVIIHLFRPEVRDFYGLEKLWSPPPGADDVSSGVGA